MTKTEFQREERYVVFKVSDLGNSLKGDEIRRLAREYAEQRRLKGKEPLECVVVEKDWPEYEPTWKAIEARVTGAQPAPSVPDGWLRAIDEALVTAHIGVANAEDTYEQAKAKLDSLIGWHTDVATDPAVNGGYRLIPIEPTEDMLRAMTDPFIAINGDNRKAFEIAYTAMLSAAPEVKP